MQTLQHFANKETAISSVPDHLDTNGTCNHLHHDIRNENIAIAERLKAHDPHILDELILRYQQRLRRYLIRLTADRELSEDLVQEAWMRVLTRGSQFDGSSQFTTWLFAIARNLAFDVRRRRDWQLNLQSMTAGENERPLEVPSGEKTPFEHCTERENAHLLADVLRTLKPQHRKLVELRFHEEMSLGEIAQTTGVPLNTVKARLYRALVSLRPQVKAALSIRSEPVGLAS
ncbi:MAG TPA: sigma-70 family RNA polymerase sigma factor [Acidobacteriaceae bacterium]|jgi:RNA polymerase sigma-70 factor (ECF subfamily)